MVAAQSDQFSFAEASTSTSSSSSWPADMSLPFSTCSPSADDSVKRFHNYSFNPRRSQAPSAPKDNFNTPNSVQFVPVQYLHGVETDSPGSVNMIAAQFSNFYFAEASAPVSSSWVDPSLPSPFTGTSDAFGFFSEDWQYDDFVRSASGLDMGSVFGPELLDSGSSWPLQNQPLWSSSSSSSLLSPYYSY